MILKIKYFSAILLILTDVIIFLTGERTSFGILLIIAGNFLFDGILNIPTDRIYAAKVVYAALIISVIFKITTVPYDAVLNTNENMLYYSIVGILESLLKLLIALIIACCEVLGVIPNNSRYPSMGNLINLDCSWKAIKPSDTMSFLLSSINV